MPTQSYSWHHSISMRSWKHLPKQPCAAILLHISCLFSLVLLSIHQLLISLLPSWCSRLPSAGNRISGWRIGVGKRTTLDPDSSQKEIVIGSIGVLLASCQGHCWTLVIAWVGLSFCKQMWLQNNSRSQVGKGSQLLQWKGNGRYESSLLLLAHGGVTNSGQPKEKT